MNRLLSLNLFLMHAISACCTYLIITVAWIFFRAENVENAMKVFNSTIFFISHPYIPSLTELGQSYPMLLIIFFFLICLVVVDAVNTRNDLCVFLCGHDLIRYIVFAFLIASVLIFGYYGNAYDAKEFVYFRF